MKASGIPYTILQPNMFFQNDAWLMEPITKYGVYPSPVGDKGCNSVDTRDIAEAAVHALTTDGDDYEGRSFVIAGPTLLTGPALAEVWSAKIGRKVAYGGNDLEAWAHQAGKMMPGSMVYDIQLMYQHFQDHGLAATLDDSRRARNRWAPAAHLRSVRHRDLGGLGRGRCVTFISARSSVAGVSSRSRTLAAARSPGIEARVSSPASQGRRSR